MNIKPLPTVNCWEIEEEFGIRVNDCYFTEECANDCYVSLMLDDEALEMLNDNIEYAIKRNKDTARYENEIALIKKFRELGYAEEILIFVSW